MIIRHADMEICRANPAAWVRDRLRGGGGMKMSYNRAVALAIHRIHGGDNRTEATRYLQALFDRLGRTNTARRADAEAILVSYATWFNAERPVVAESLLRIRFPLTGRIEMGGEVSRLEVARDGSGYVGVLLASSLLQSWQRELRMPLLQAALAARAQRPLSEVSVGVQLLDGSGYSVHRFRDTEIQRALREARKLAVAVEAALP